MSKILLTVFIFLSLLTFPNQVSAATFPAKIIDPASQNIYPDTPKITIEVTSDQDSFNPDTPYTFSAWDSTNSTKGELSCSVSQYNKNPIVEPTTQFDITSQKITISWKQRGCMTDPGPHKFQLWAGQGTASRNSASLLSELDFTIQQAGGGIPALSPLQQTVLLGTKPTVLVSNARTGNTYSFWWNGAQIELAAHYPPDGTLNNGILFVPLNLTGLSEPFKAGQTYKICMDVADYHVPAGKTCKYSTNFTFSNTPPPPASLSCKILPSITPSVTDDVRLQISNAVPGTVYITDLKKDGDDFKTINPLAVDTSFKTLIIPLGEKLPQGTYQIHVYNSSTGQSLDACTQGFSVGDVGTADTFKDICKKDQEKCSSAGGEPCTTDSKNPGFKTAIGCIHSTPKAFVEDVLKFATGVGGGLAFMMMLFGAFQMMKSAGNPQSLQEGKDVFTNAVIGILFIIFSILLMKIIGIDILSLPDFSNP